MAPQAAGTVSLDDVRAAARLLTGVAKRTPIETSRPLTELIGAPVSFKCENLQRAGSFKLRGAYVRMSRLSEEDKSRGVVAASAGNHAQGVALAAQMLGLRATVCMPTDAALPKVAATRDYGAEVLLGGRTVEDALAAAHRVAARTGAVLIHPFDHADVVAGQGTVGLELLEQVPDLRTVVVPTGGGGLLAGIAVAIKSVRPDVRVVGVQAVRAGSLLPSLAAGQVTSTPVHSTMADGIALAAPGAVPFELVRDLVDDVIEVSEEDLSRALLFVAERAKLLVEPAGAAGVAAVMARPEIAEGPTAIVLSGGNVDPLLLLRVVRHGLVSAGRYLHLRLRIADRPGELAGVLGLLAASGANIEQIQHMRTGPDLRVDEVELDAQVGTKGTEHCQQIIEDLLAAGYTVLSPL